MTARNKSKKLTDSLPTEEEQEDSASYASMDAISTMQQLMISMEKSRQEDKIRDERRREEKEKERHEQRKQDQEQLRQSQESMMALLKELEDSKAKQTEKIFTQKKNLMAIPKWTDNDKPADFMQRFEQAMECNEEPQERWARLLAMQLSGRAYSIYNTRVPTEMRNDYNCIKMTLLDSFGDTVLQARRELWTMKKKHGESAQELVVRIEAKIKRGLEGCNDETDIIAQLSLYKFLSTLPFDVNSFVLGRNPKTAMEAAHLETEYQASQSWKSRPSYQPRYDRRDNDGSYRREKYEHNEVKREPTATSAASGKVDKSETHTKQQHDSSSRTPTCYLCHEKGHKRPECPRRIHRIYSQKKPRRVAFVCGKVGEIQCNFLRLDAGSDCSVVHPRLVKPEQYLEEDINIQGFGDKSVHSYPMARVQFKIGGNLEECDVAVTEDVEPADALLGMDLECYDSVWELREMCESENKLRAHVLRTRAQSAAEATQQQQDDEATRQSGANTINLSDIYNFDNDSLFSQEQQVQTVPDSDDPLDLPLPCLVNDSADKDALVQEQKNDQTLEPARQLVDIPDAGYSYIDELLVHKEEDELGTIWTRVVVPDGRRPAVIKLAHSTKTGGHFGVKKTATKLRKHFTWPGISRDIKKWCSTCPQCQKAARNSHQRAPLIPLPRIDVPFSRVAFDIVGPLPRTKSGYKYILTSMCYASKYPEAIALKRVDARTVADAMMETFSRTGIPDEVLTDQGSVFMGELNTHLCKMLDISRLRTSPYHPQSDGMLERFHASLKLMIRKAEVNQNEWDGYLKFLLFAYRNTPHTVTGYSPFEIIYGRDVRGPLEILKQGWLEGDIPEKSVHEWVEQLHKKMQQMTEIVGKREKKAKAKMKKTYDKSAHNRDLECGSMVLVRIPGRTGKLEDSWEGPFEVLEQISPVNYKLAVPKHPRRSSVLHVNMLRPWKNPEAHVLRIVVADEDGQDDKDNLPPPSYGADLATEQVKVMDNILSEFKDVIQTEPGKVNIMEHAIDTGATSPIRIPPYRLAPAWKDQLRTEVRTLATAGIIRPSHSPWSSPMIPIRKKDGNVRLCVDFRKINSVTVPDPYLMPRVDEILDQLGEATYLTKMDLNKGFHQVPLKDSDIPKTAFCTPWGKFEYTHMPFGLMNAPATFQRLMDVVLDDMLDFAKAYIDDVVVFSRTWEDHVKHLRLVLERLKEVGLTAKPSKCQWATASCTYLGHVVGRGKVRPDEIKVQAVKEFVRPKSKTDMRSFLGLTGYYRRFIPAYADHSIALTDATKKIAPQKVTWTKELEDEFNYLREALCSYTALTIPTPSDSFVLQTDASMLGIGGVLSVQRGELELPVAFYSRKLLDRERRYSATELEGLAIVDSVAHFDVYLVGRPFTIETDHRALSFLNTSKLANGRLARWAIRLQPFTYTIRYRPGSKNGNADGLSRQAWISTDGQPPDDCLRPLEEEGDVMPQA